MLTEWMGRGASRDPSVKDAEQDPPFPRNVQTPLRRGFFISCAPHDHSNGPAMTLISVPATAPPAIRESAPRVAAASLFVAEACGRDLSLLASLIDSGDLETAAPAAPADALAFFESRAPAWPAAAEPDEPALMAAL